MEEDGVGMRGDLHTLKKACLYGSKVMVCGAMVIAAVIVIIVALGVGSFVSDTFSDVLGGIMQLSFEEDPATVIAVSYAEMILILLLAFVTVLTIYWTMSSIHEEHSPFSSENTDRAMVLSKIYIIAAIVLSVLELFGERGLGSALFMFFGCILIAVVLFMFSLIIRYGSVLQDESDHTL